MTDKIITPVFRVSFPHIMEPAWNMQKTKKKFSLVMLFPENTDLSELVKITEQAKEDKWGKKIPNNLRPTFRKGTGHINKSGDQYEGYEGCIFASAGSQEQSRPGLVDRNKGKIIDPNEFYAGCYAIATLQAYAYDTAGNRGVSFALHNVMKWDDGESLTGRVKAENDFDSIETSVPKGTNNLINPLDI